MLPEWIAQPASPRSSSRRGPMMFLERTLHDSARLVQSAVFAEQIARQPGFLQGLNARVKLISLVALLVTSTFLHHLPSLWLLAACIAAAALVSRVTPRMLLNRVWWFLPATFALLTLPAAFNLITPGDPLFVLFQTSAPEIGPFRLPGEISVTRQGVAASGLLLTRLLVGVLLAITLALTTRWQDLLKAGYLAATAPFILILAMMHRYLFVLLHSVENMHLARLARTISVGALSEQRHWIGSRIAALFTQSRSLSEEVYQAMIARGYRGEPKQLVTSHLGMRDAAWLAGCLALIVLSLLFDRAVLAQLPW